eukprot:4648449-Pyramimonas_sp.AAC.1
MLMTSIGGSVEMREVVSATLREFPNLRATGRRSNMFDRSWKPIAINRPGAQLLKKKVVRK